MWPESYSSYVDFFIGDYFL